MSTEHFGENARVSSNLAIVPAASFAIRSAPEYEPVSAGGLSSNSPRLGTCSTGGSSGRSARTAVVAANVNTTSNTEPILGVIADSRFLKARDVNRQRAGD